MNLDNERKAFEDWAYSNKWNIFKVTFANDDVEKYADDFVEGAYHGWIQSANREGYKLVPVVDSDAMWSAGMVIIEENGYCTDASNVYKAMIEVA